MSLWSTTLGPLSVLDVALAAVWLYLVIVNARAGLIRALGNVLGTILAFAIAGRVYDDVGAILPGAPTVAAANAAGFLIAYFVVTILVGLIVYIADKLFLVFKFIPGFGMANTIGGAVVGFAKASILIGALIIVLSQFSSDVGIQDALTNSRLVPIFIWFGQVATWLLPESLRQLPTF